MRRRLLPEAPAGWARLARQLRDLGSEDGPARVHARVLAPFLACVGYGPPRRQPLVVTREGEEDGGWLCRAPDGTALRSFAAALGAAEGGTVATRGPRAYRDSPLRSAFRVLRACGERAGVLTDGAVLCLLLADPTRADTRIELPVAACAAPIPPDGARLLLALATPAGLAALPALLEAARLAQVRVTGTLRLQARAAVEGFVQAVLDHPDNAALRRDRARHARAEPCAGPAPLSRARQAPPPDLPAQLWREALVMIYRLLFLFRLESTGDPARGFGFAATPAWREGLSPLRALAPIARRVLDQGADTGRMLEDGLRATFRAMRDGLDCADLSITPLGGALFGAASTPLLDAARWSERGVAALLDRLLWTETGSTARARIQYGALDVEDLGRVYEALLDLEPAIADRPMVRLRRGRQETVVPADDARLADGIVAVENIPAGRFLLRPGLGRKANGAFYTPHPLVRALVDRTLAPLLAARSPPEDPDPGAILGLKLLDPATGSGHFLVEACRVLGEALHEACRRCDALAAAADRAVAEARADERVHLAARAALLRGRITGLPDPDRSLAAYLPSRGGGPLAEARAAALCRRLVAVHCLYGVDRNPLAVELAKLSLWLESYAEGLPLTFLDHRLLVGDSLAGPALADLSTLPVGTAPLDPLLGRGVAVRLAAARDAALAEIGALDATLGRDAADLMLKQQAAARLDTTLGPLRRLARAWSGAAALQRRDGDDAWLALARHVAETGTWPTRLTPAQAALEAAGVEALSFDLHFPDVFPPEGRGCEPAGAQSRGSGGFDAVIGNPPWGVLQPLAKDFVSGWDLRILDAPTKAERAAIEARVLADPAVATAWDAYRAGFARQKALAERLFRHQRATLGREATGGNLDTYRLFAERAVQLSGPAGAIGLLLPSSFHANEGSTGVRRLFFAQTRWETCWSFENRRKLFDIDSRAKFALVVAHRPGPTVGIDAAFYLTELGELDQPGRRLRLEPALLAATGGAHLALPELRSAADLAVLRCLNRAPERLDGWCRGRGIGFGTDLHMTADSAAFRPVGQGLPMHEGKSFHQFTDTWQTMPRYAVPEAALSPRTGAAAAHYRLAFRDVARSTDERTAIAMIAPPGTVFGHTAVVERTPEQRPIGVALLLCAVMNSYPFDWLVRQKAAAHLSLYLLGSLPVPAFSASDAAFLQRAALRLCCNHAGYASLWAAETGRRRMEWPALAAPTERRALRAEMDAVIAQAYGLDRIGYAQILAAFSHRSWPEAPAQCLAAYDRRCAARSSSIRAAS